MGESERGGKGKATPKLEILELRQCAVRAGEPRRRLIEVREGLHARHQRSDGGNPHMKTCAASVAPLDRQATSAHTVCILQGVS